VASNGVIHAVNQVLSPQSIVEFTVANENLTSLTDALTSANLVAALSGTDPLTVFAPDNDAFEAIADVVAGLSPEQLTQVLTYHVVAGNVRAENISPGAVPTLNTDANITLSLEDGAQIIDAAGNVINIVATDIQGTNGVIHLIDAVLIPFE
jgi:transforming growth factor-beta-induced protein